MKAVLIEVPQTLLEERRRSGLDRLDELWDGVLHMVQPPSELHQRVATRLLTVLAPAAERRGLRAYYELGLFRSAADYRVPDQMYVSPERTSTRGVEGAAELVVELRSPGDKTYEKVDWYAARGVGELLIVHPEERRVELLRNVGGRLLPVTAEAEGAVRCDTLGVAFSTVEGPLLRVSWPDGRIDI